MSATKKKLIHNSAAEFLIFNGQAIESRSARDEMPALENQA